MPLLSVRRRVGKLEASGLFLPPDVYPPLTSAEVEEFATRARIGSRFSRQELDRLQQYTPIVDGEILMSAYSGNVFVKRYPGLDVSEI